MRAPLSSRSRTQKEIDANEALNLIAQAGLRFRPGVNGPALARAVASRATENRPLSEFLFLLACGDRLAAEFDPGALLEGALSPNLLALRISKEARIDPAAALPALARLAGEPNRLRGPVQTLQPGDGFEYLAFKLDGAAQEIAIDATAGFDPAAELSRLARILEQGRKAFYLHRRGALLLILHLHEESAEALSAAEPGLLEPLTSLEVDLPMLRLSRKTLRRMPILLSVLAATLWLYAEATGAVLPLYGAGACAIGALFLGGPSLARLFRARS